MADNDKPKMSTCPICGYTDTADDAGALHSAIEEHIRKAHNLNPATLGGGTSGSVKPVSNETAAEVGGSNSTGATIPIIAAAPSNIGGSGTTGAGAGILGAAALNDTNENTNTDNTSTRKNDETSRY